MSDIQTPEFGLGDESKKTTVEQVEDDIEYTSIVVGGVAMVTAFFGGVFGGGAFLKRGNMVIRHLDALEAKERRLAEGGYRHPEVTAAAAPTPPVPPLPTIPPTPPKLPLLPTPPRPLLSPPLNNNGHARPCCECGRTVPSSNSNRVVVS